jgi:hypothetical protein
MRLEWIVEPGGRYMARICGVCGEVLDPQILANRELSLRRVLTGRMLLGQRGPLQRLCRKTKEGRQEKSQEVIPGREEVSPD